MLSVVGQYCELTRVIVLNSRGSSAISGGTKRNKFIIKQSVAITVFKVTHS